MLRSSSSTTTTTSALDVKAKAGATRGVQEGQQVCGLGSVCMRVYLGTFVGCEGQQVRSLSLHACTAQLHDADTQTTDLFGDPVQQFCSILKTSGASGVRHPDNENNNN
jgi:hypothetical protein